MIAWTVVCCAFCEQPFSDRVPSLVRVERNLSLVGIDATLEVGNLSQSVSVVAEAPQVDSRSSTVGTLIDSRQDLCNSINAMLTHFGKPELPEAVIASYIGDGASMLVRRALGDPEGDFHDAEFVTEALGFFLDYYRVHKLDFTYVYPGVMEALAA